MPVKKYLASLFLLRFENLPLVGDALDYRIGKEKAPSRGDTTYSVTNEMGVGDTPIVAASSERACARWGHRRCAEASKPYVYPSVES